MSDKPDYIGNTTDGSVEEAFCDGTIDAGSLSPIALAFMGDAVYESLVRDYLIRIKRLPTSKLHRSCVSYVNAGTQSQFVRLLMPQLTDEEQNILRRGRNASTSHVPKNASPIEYRHATGLEALFGYLYFCGRQKRINELFTAITSFDLKAAKGADIVENAE